MIIDLLELFISKDKVIWVADGIQVPASWLTGKFIQTMIVKEDL